VEICGVLDRKRITVRNGQPVVNRDADQYGRGAGVSALALLVAWAEIPRESVVEYFLWLAQEGLERKPNQVWDSLVAESADIEALVVFPALRRAYSDGLADPQSIAPDELAESRISAAWTNARSHARASTAH
jgi:hypothetical protein